MVTLSLTALIGIASILIATIRWIYTTFFSKNAKADAVLAWVERGKARLKAERDRLRAANTRIDREPPKTDQELIDKLNNEFRGKK